MCHWCWFKGSTAKAAAPFSNSVWRAPILWYASFRCLILLFTLLILSYTLKNIDFWPRAGFYSFLIKFLIHFLPSCLSLCFSPLTWNWWLYFEFLPLPLCQEKDYSCLRIINYFLGRLLWNNSKTIMIFFSEFLPKLHSFPHAHQQALSSVISFWIPTSSTYCLVAPQLFWSEPSCLINFSFISNIARHGVGIFTFNIYWST